MSPTYAQNKEHIYKYRETHPEIIKIIAKTHYENHKQQIFQKAYGKARYLTECKRFRNILI